MTKFLFAVMTSFGRAFASSAIVLSVGILEAPDLVAARALSVAALLASIAAGVRAVQVLVPSLSFASLLPQPLAAWVDSFARAFLSTFLVGVTGWLAAPNFEAWKAVVVAVIVGALAAGMRAVQGLATSGEQPAPDTGV